MLMGVEEEGWVEGEWGEREGGKWREEGKWGEESSEIHAVIGRMYKLYTDRTRDQD